MKNNQIRGEIPSNNQRITGTNSNEIETKINEINEFLIENVQGFTGVTAKELIDYFDGDAPSGDETTVKDVIANKWLLIHELIEINELKKMGLQISAKLLFTHAREVEFAHITATEHEFSYADQSGDKSWIISRLKDVKNWLQDDNLPEEVHKRCMGLLEKYSS